MENEIAPSSKQELSTSAPEKSVNDSYKASNGGEANELSEVVLRKRSDTNPSTHISSNLSSPTSNSSLHMSLNINPTAGEQDKNAKVFSSSNSYFKSIILLYLQSEFINQYIHID